MSFRGNGHINFVAIGTTIKYKVEKSRLATQTTYGEAAEAIKKIEK